MPSTALNVDRSARTTSVLVVGVVVMGLLSGCVSSRPSMHPAPPPETAPRTQPSPRAAASVEPAVPPRADRTVEQLRAATQDWIGVPYRFGGTSRRGIDCSAFVQTVYRDVFGLSLPRVTADQVRAGSGVARGTFQPGDLVFFRPSSKGRHVGIYLGDGEFVHASTSEGVTVSQLNNGYWHDVYWTTRRVLPTEPRPVATRPPVPHAAPLDPGQRTGW